MCAANTSGAAIMKKNPLVHLNDNVIIFINSYKYNLCLKNINDINEFNQLDLNLSLSEGNISPSNSSVMWKDDLQIELDESYLIYDKNEIYLVSLPAEVISV